MRNLESPLNWRKPSEVALPLLTNWRLLPEPDVGMAIDCTSEPVTVYSSRNTAVPVLPRVADPSPIRVTTMLPCVKAPPKALAVIPIASIAADIKRTLIPQTLQKDMPY